MTPEQLAAELVTVEQRGPAAVQCYSVLVAGVVVRGLLDGGRARTLAGEVRAALAVRLGAVQEEHDRLLAEAWREARELEGD
jgi:hypothetical protein